MLRTQIFDKKRAQKLISAVDFAKHSKSMPEQKRDARDASQ